MMPCSLGRSKRDSGVSRRLPLGAMDSRGLLAQIARSTGLMRATQLVAQMSLDSLSKLPPRQKAGGYVEPAHPLKVIKQPY